MLGRRKGPALVEAMPQNRVLIETDGPFARAGNGPLMPWDVADAVGRLADLWHKSHSEVDQMLQSNFEVLIAPGLLGR